MTCQCACPISCSELGCEDATGYSKGCPSGWFGFQCCVDCKICRNELCELQKCTNGFKDQEEYIDPFLSYSIPCAKNNCTYNLLQPYLLHPVR
jgi:hypothetical protein